jgi:2-polyprenyl-6-hydroxyphenyl methylase/3-demethylubiquinone-9 3-methyltransferase
MNNLKEVSAHFKFGENWKDYADLIDETKIKDAEEGLLKLIPRENIEGANFLDIGCGSGVHVLCVLKNGAKNVLATDIDKDSVETTHTLLGKTSPNTNWKVKLASVFDLTPEKIGGGAGWEV